MPPIRQYAEFPINPVQANKLLPLPGESKRTGLLCPSCIKPHSTSYYSPSNQPHVPLIGVQCRAAGYNRSYSREQATTAILKHNLGIRGRAQPTANQINSDYQFAMQVSALINGDMPGAPSYTAPTVTQTKKTPTLPLDQQCQGYNGQFAARHTARRNAGCAIKACRHCCEQLKPPHLRCTKHKTTGQSQSSNATNATNAMRHQPHGTDIFTQADSDPILTQGDLTTPPQPETQATNPFSGTLTPAQVTRFRITTIQKQAKEREDNEHADVASKTVTFVVWSGLNMSQEDPLACETWRVYAPQWPHLSLDQSTTLVEQVQEKFGALWKGKLRVWIPEEKTWVKMQTSIIEAYNPNYRRILIVFPGIKVDECKEIESQLEKVSTMTNVQKMDMKHILSPKAYSRFAHLTPTPQENRFTVISDDEEDELAEDSIPRETSRSSRSPSSDLPPADLDWAAAPATANVVQPPRASSSTSTANANRPATTTSKATTSKAKTSKVRSKRTKESWPTAPTIITMKSLHEFLLLTMEPHKLTLRVAFNRVYGETHVYVRSTVIKYRKWLYDCVTPDRLAEYVKAHSNHTVLDGRDSFADEWRVLDNRTNTAQETEEAVEETEEAV